jgi:hypothetical protein
MTTGDIPKETEQETDAVAERIFTEWDKWFDNPPDKRKEELRDMQNELRELYDKYVVACEPNEKDETAVAELLEHITVLDKKMRQTKNKLMKELWK